MPKKSKLRRRSAAYWALERQGKEDKMGGQTKGGSGGQKISVCRKHTAIMPGITSQERTSPHVYPNIL